MLFSRMKISASIWLFFRVDHREKQCVKVAQAVFHFFRLTCLGAHGNHLESIGKIIF